jgi:predicted RNA-binding protein with PIN domain
VGSDERTALIVDGNNVMGSTPDGWWRDRGGAVHRLLDRLQCFAATTEQAIELVLDVPQPDLAEGDHEGVVVRYATRRGRDAADDRIVELLDEDRSAVVRVVTSDRTLARRARDRGAHVVGAGAFLRQVDDAGC